MSLFQEARSTPGLLRLAAARRGRASGSDVWKCYMRRQSNTLKGSGKCRRLRYAKGAQGISFDM